MTAEEIFERSQIVNEPAEETKNDDCPYILHYYFFASGHTSDGDVSLDDHDSYVNEHSDDHVAAELIVLCGFL